MDGRVGGWVEGASFGGRWGAESLPGLQDRAPPAPPSCPCGGELGGADRETGRKPLWGSIVLQMNRRLQRAFSAPLCGVEGGWQQNTHTHTHTHRIHSQLKRELYLLVRVCYCCITTHAQVKLTPARFSLNISDSHDD